MENGMLINTLQSTPEFSRSYEKRLLKNIVGKEGITAAFHSFLTMFLPHVS